MGQMICKLSNGNRLEIRDISVGKDSAILRFEKTYEEVTSFLGNNIITSIEIIVDNGESGETVSESYSVYFEPKSITVAQENIMDSDLNEERKVVVTERVANIVTVQLMTPNVSKQIEEIKETVGMVNPDTLSLPEYKLYAINKSKDDLKLYLLEHPLSSNVHNSTTESYSITEEKQTLLMKEIMLSTLASTTEDAEYSPSWNASGKQCESWTLEELVKLSYQMAAVVKPLVSYQQSLEEQIMQKESISDIKSIEFDFASYDPRNSEPGE